MTGRRPWRRAMKRIAFGVLAVIVLLIALAIPAPLLIRGARFGTVVGWMLPATRGKITVGGGRWSWGAVWELLHGRPAPLELDGLRVVDPEGTEVLRAAHVTVAVEMGRDPARLILHDLHVTDGLWRMASMRGERTSGLVAAIQSPRRAAGRARAPVARLRVCHPRRGPRRYRDHPRLSRAGACRWRGCARAATWQSGRPRAPRADRGRPSSSRSTSATPTWAAAACCASSTDAARVELPFSAGRIERVATTSDAPDDLRLDADGVATGASRLSVHGAFTGIYGVSRPRRPPGMDLRAHLEHAADAVRAILARRKPPLPVSVGAGDADFQLGFAGPFNRMKITAAARGFDLGLRDLDFRGVGFDVAIEPAAARARVAGLTFASPGGGRLTLDADLDHRLVHGALAADQLCHRALPAGVPARARGRRARRAAAWRDRSREPQPARSTSWR